MAGRTQIAGQRQTMSAHGMIPDDIVACHDQGHGPQAEGPQQPVSKGRRAHVHTCCCVRGRLEEAERHRWLRVTTAGDCGEHHAMRHSIGQGISTHEPFRHWHTRKTQNPAAVPVRLHPHSGRSHKQMTKASDHIRRTKQQPFECFHQGLRRHCELRKLQGACTSGKAEGVEPDQRCSCGGTTYGSKGRAARQLHIASQ